MDDQTPQTQSHAWTAAAFWADVDREIEHADLAELAWFAHADALPLELRPGFERELWQRLRASISHPPLGA